MRVRDSNRAAAFLLLTEDQWKNTLAVASKLPENLVNRLALDNIPLFLPNAFHQRVQILGISGLTGAAEPNMGEEQDIEAALQDLRREVDRIHSVLDKMLSAIQATRSAAVEHSKLAGIDIITSERAIELDAYPELDPRKATTFAGPYVNTIKNSMSDKEHAYKFHEFIQRHGHGNLSLVFVATLRWELGDPTIPEQEHLVTHTNQLPNTVTGFFPPLLPLQSHEEEEDYPFFIHGPLSPEHIMKIKSPSMLQSLARSMWLELDATATLQTNAKMILKQVRMMTCPAPRML